MIKVLIIKPRISNKIRRWIRLVTNDQNIIKRKKRKFISECQRIKEKKLYDQEYYWMFKNKINERQRCNYRIRKKDTNVKFI